MAKPLTVCNEPVTVCWFRSPQEAAGNEPAVERQNPVSNQSPPRRRPHRRPRHQVRPAHQWAQFFNTSVWRRSESLIQREKERRERERERSTSLKTQRLFTWRLPCVFRGLRHWWELKSQASLGEWNDSCAFVIYLAGVCTHATFTSLLRSPAFYLPEEL